MFSPSLHIAGKRIVDKCQQYVRLTRLDKPIGILLLLWPTLWGLWIASYGILQPKLLVIFLVGTVLMRSAGCAINDYADRDFDRHVLRTRLRPVTTGAVSGREALILAAMLTLLALLLILPLNGLTLWMSLPAVFIAASYPYTKRFFPLPQAYLGIAFSFGIIMAFAAVQGHIPFIAWYLLIINGFWVVAYDTEYAMVDKTDDLKIGIKTSAITFGRFDAKAVLLCHAVFIIGMAQLGHYLQRGLFWHGGLVIAAIHMLWQYQQIRPRSNGATDRQACFRAFRSNHWVGLIIFIAIALDFSRI